MHWGIRRFQPYPDGHRGGKVVGQAARRKKKKGSGLLDPTIKQGKGKDNISPAEKATRETRNAADNSASALRKIGKSKTDINRAKGNPELEKKIKSMSDQELSQAIRRIELERRYRDLNTTTIKNGYEKAADILDVAGDVAGIAVAAASIATLMKPSVHKARHTAKLAKGVRMLYRK